VQKFLHLFQFHVQYFQFSYINATGQRAQVVKYSLLVQEVWGDSPLLQPWLCGPWRKAAEMGTAHSWHPKGY